MLHDLVVVGAGPAGAAAVLTARRLAPDASLAVVERAAFPRDKPCGDALSPDAVAELSRLGIPAAVDGYPAVARLRLRSPAGVEVADVPPAAGYVIPRRVLDARLAAASRAAATMWHTARVRAVHVAADAVVLRTDDGVVRGRVVIGADGANSVVGRAVVGPLPARHVGVAVRGYVPAPDGPAELQLIWERAHGLAYAWSFPIDDDRCNVGYGVFGRDAARAASRADLIGRMEALVPHSSGAERLRGHRLPLSSGGHRLGRGRVLLAGDAAALVNPITGEGIYYALLSGRIAAQAAIGDPAGPVGPYRTLLGATLGAHLRSTRLLARFAGTGPVLDHLVRAAAASPVTADLLADLAFGKGALTPMTTRTIIGGLCATVRAPGPRRRTAPPSRATPRARSHSGGRR